MRCAVSFKTARMRSRSAAGVSGGRWVKLRSNSASDSYSRRRLSWSNLMVQLRLTARITEAPTSGQRRAVPVGEQPFDSRIARGRVRRCKEGPQKKSPLKTGRDGNGIARVGDPCEKHWSVAAFGGNPAEGACNTAPRSTDAPDHLSSAIQVDSFALRDYAAT